MKKIKPKIPKINCATCFKRSSCTRLCKAAEQYVNQDVVGAVEGITVSNPRDSADLKIWSDTDISAADSPKIGNRDVMIAVLISAGIPRSYIRKYLKLSDLGLRKVIERLRKKGAIT